ncbi:MAG: GGDEF domain-containing protein, partial [Candidatus Competibacter denitrificans]
KALYYAKEHGRNQVCSYEKLIANGALAAPDDHFGDIELF